MFEDVNIETIKTIRRVIKSIERFVLIFIMPLLISQALYFLFYRKRDIIYGFYITKESLILCVVLTLFAGFSFTRTTMVFDNERRKKFFGYGKPINGLMSKLRYLFSQKDYLIELGIAALMYIFVPMEVLCECFCNYFIAHGTGTLAQTKLLSIVIPTMFLINIWGHISAINYWHKYERKLGELELKKQKAKLRRRLFSVTGAYIAGGIAFEMALPHVLRYLGLIFSSYTAILFIAILFLFMPTYRAVRALIKRRSFIKRLKRVCREKKYRLSKINRPYRSIFSPNRGEDFSVYIRKKRYSCKLFPATRKLTPLILYPNATGMFMITLKVLHFELLQYNKKFEYGYEAEGKKLLIINPIAKKVLTPFGNKIVEIDNGDNLGEFEIYGATAFLHALERDVIDK